MPKSCVGLGELDDRAVRLARQQERFLPLRIGEVDVDGREPGRSEALDRREQVGHLEREVVRAGAVAGDEPGEEVVAARRPRFEQLDAHAVAGVVADPHLHRPEPDAGRRR